MLLEARLNARTKADKTALNEALARAAALDLSLYDEADVEALNAILTRAKTISDDPYATQDTVDAIVEELNAELDALKPAEGTSASDVTAEGSADSPDRADTAETGTRSGMGALLAMMALSGGMMIIPGLRRRKSEEQ